MTERFCESIKYEHLYRLEVPSGFEISEVATRCRTIYNEVRPHENLDSSLPSRST
jgi:hypothetical protein